MDPVPEQITLEQHEIELLNELRNLRRERTKAESAPITIGARIADAVTDAMGSWWFIIIQTTFLALWILYNAISGKAFDPYPFILLNLGLSFQAAYAAPFIMMSQNRQAEIDRKAAHDDYRINEKAELEIEFLHYKIDLLRQEEVSRLIQIVQSMEARIDSSK